MVYACLLDFGITKIARLLLDRCLNPDLISLGGLPLPAELGGLAELFTIFGRSSWDCLQIYGLFLHSRSQNSISSCHYVAPHVLLGIGLLNLVDHAVEITHARLVI